MFKLSRRQLSTFAANFFGRPRPSVSVDWRSTNDLVIKSRRRSILAQAALVASYLLAPANVFCSEPKQADTEASVAEGETQLARRKIERALSPRRVAQIDPIASGYSGAHTYRVTDDQRQQYFAKLGQSWADTAETLHVRAEIEHAVWAAERGLGPAVVFADAVDTTLITTFLRNEMDAWGQGGQEPRLSATLATMRRLHESEPLDTRRPYDKKSAAAWWRQELAKVSPADRDSPFVTEAARIAEACIDKLSAYSFDAVILHGDFHQSNVIYASGTAWLIDWGSRNEGDAMEELAYFAYHIDVSLSDIDPLLVKYGRLSSEEVDRAKCHLAYLHAHRYLQTLKGMPWDRPERRERALRLHESYLRDDSQWLNLRDSP